MTSLFFSMMFRFSPTGFAQLHGHHRHEASNSVRHQWLQAASRLPPRFRLGGAPFPSGRSWSSLPRALRHKVPDVVEQEPATWHAVATVTAFTLSSLIACPPRS